MYLLYGEGMIRMWLRVICDVMMHN